MEKFKKLLFGSRAKTGLAAKILLYLLLIGIGFVFIYPLLIVFSTSGKDLYGLVDPLVKWVPETFCFDNYVKAYQVLGGVHTLLVSLGVTLLIAAAQTFSSALVGYGLAKFEFPGKKLVFGLVIAAFIIPSQVAMLPQYVLFGKYHLINSIWPVLLPSFFCQGIKNTIFILLFFQFFKMTSKSLDEAATVDGAGKLRIFFRINLKMAIPAIVIVSIFSFVWNWNETDMAGTYFGTAVTTLPLALERFKQAYDNLFPFSVDGSQPTQRLNEGIEMAGTLLSILPLILMYLLVERHLVEGIDKSGISGE